MNIKSLLLGSAAALVAATGARAADAIVIAEPEPMEYVRICDMYGAGFFYIPGTENCLKIGGYVRYQMNYSNADQWVFAAPDANGDFNGTINETYRFSKLARFAPTFDVRNETEWGTLRGFAEVEFDWNSSSWSGPGRGRLTSDTYFGWWYTEGYRLGGGQSVNLNHAFIELQQAMGTLRIGKGDTPYARFLGYGSGNVYGGAYGFANSGEVSYTFTGGNGFSAILAAVESSTGLFEPRIEGGVNFAQGWGSIGAIVGYDTPAGEWGAKVVARGNFGPVAVGAHVFYASSGNAYSANGGGTGQGTSEWSVLAHAKVSATEKVAVAASVQWFDGQYGSVSAGNDYWQIVGGLDLTPVSGLRIRPEVRYTTGVELWEAAIRFDRSF